jgi:hypothetical protein
MYPIGISKVTILDLKPKSLAPAYYQSAHHFLNDVVLVLMWKHR